MPINMVVADGIVKSLALKYGADGKPECRFTLHQEENGFPLFIPCTAVGQAAERLAGELEDGMHVVITSGNMKFLLAGRPGGIEVKWDQPGTGSCQVWVPKTWDDEPRRFYLYSALCDAAGFEGEKLFDVYADPSYSVTDRDNLEVACAELVQLSGEFHRLDLKFTVGVLQQVAQHLLRPHRDTLAALAAHAAGRRYWNGDEIHGAILRCSPSYHGHEGLFDREEWYGAWLDVLEDFDRAHEAQARRMQEVQQRLARRFG